MTVEVNAMKIIKPTAEPSNEAPAEYFTGGVRVTPLVKGENPSCLTCASVGFLPGARSAWHTHPKGQLLIVTEGSGLIQEWRKPVRKIVKGDVIWTPPAVKHWHGASPESAMTHTACQETQDGRNVEWMEKVTDQEYRSTPQGSAVQHTVRSVAHIGNLMTYLSRGDELRHDLHTTGQVRRYWGIHYAARRARHCSMRSAVEPRNTSDRACRRLKKSPSM